MPTIKDVADACGVSAATVSYVLNNRGAISPHTRERILAAAKELGYHPNATARGLARRRMNTLGVLFAGPHFAVLLSHYMAAILQGILDGAAEAGYNVTLFTHPWEGTANSAAQLDDGRTDGILGVASDIDSDLIGATTAMRRPLVLISSPYGDLPATFVYGDDRMGARQATEYLLDLGHTRVAHLMGPENRSSVPPRRDAFLETMAGRGLSVPPEYLAYGDYGGGLAYQQTLRLLALPQPPTAIFAGNDYIAAGVLRAANERGVAVPERLSVVGYDDTLVTTLTTPSLTSVHQPLREIGRVAARLLVARLEGERDGKEDVTPRPHLLDTHLAVRGSTAPPAP